MSIENVDVANRDEAINLALALTTAMRDAVIQLTRELLEEGSLDAAALDRIRRSIDQSLDENTYISPTKREMLKGNLAERFDEAADSVGNPK